MWLASRVLEEIAAALADIDGRNSEDVYETLRQGIFSVKDHPPAVFTLLAFFFHYSACKNTT